MEPITTEIDYFKKPGVNNSFLGDVKNITEGKSLFKCSQETLDFGSQLHEALLERHKYESSKHLPNYKTNIHKINEMVKSARKNALLTILLDSPLTEFETEVFFETQGVNCKLKADMKKGTIVGDLKTTDAITREEFLMRAIEYGYIRQGAFYLDGTGASRFMIFAISKRYPHPTFTYVLDRNDIQIETGRQEYIDLIQRYKSLSPEQLNLLKKI